MSNRTTLGKRNPQDYFSDFDSKTSSYMGYSLSRDRKSSTSTRKLDTDISKSSVYSRPVRTSKLTQEIPKSIDNYLRNRSSYSNVSPFVKPVPTENKETIIDMQSSSNELNSLPTYFPDINKLLAENVPDRELKAEIQENLEISESPNVGLTSIEDILSSKKNVVENNEDKDELRYKKIDSNQNTIRMADTQLRMTNTMQSLSDIIKTPSDSTNVIRKVSNSIFPDLNVDSINASLKVMGNLQKGFKLMLKDNDSCLGVDQSNYMFSRKYKREDIELFLLHLENQISKVLNQLLTDIQKGVDMDNNISALDEMLHNLAVANHNYDSISSVYQADTLAYSKFMTIKNKFTTLWKNFIRKMALVIQS